MFLGSATWLRYVYTNVKMSTTLTDHNFRLLRSEEIRSLGIWSGEERLSTGNAAISSDSKMTLWKKYRRFVTLDDVLETSGVHHVFSYSCIEPQRDLCRSLCPVAATGMIYRP